MLSLYIDCACLKINLLSIRCLEEDSSFCSLSPTSTSGSSGASSASYYYFGERKVGMIKCDLYKPVTRRWQKAKDCLDLTLFASLICFCCHYIGTTSGTYVISTRTLVTLVGIQTVALWHRKLPLYLMATANAAS